MILYKISVNQPSSHYIDIELSIDQINTENVLLQLPAWRPGRYELGNFAKNIKHVEVYDINGQALSFQKQNKDSWLIHTHPSSQIKICYSYYAAEINAGSCYTDENQLYINPVHLCMYIPERMNEVHHIELDIPNSFQIASSLKKENKKLIASSFDELADSPIIASTQLKSDYYEVNGIKFWLHFNGECRPDWKKIKEHFTKFTVTQLKFWKDFPVDEYHFLFQVLPYKFYHGVEHLKSTVIALGPGHSINQGKTYEDLLGVSSHELFHTWNIKFIRPVEMLPYDFTKENYARTGYVYEGFTTYYGDLILRSSGVFTDEEYFETLEERLNKHFHNDGRFNLSVSHSSWDTWLDGYVPGAPYRKTSIYDEGNLIAFMLDVLILKNSGNKKSLRDVCLSLYHLYGKKGLGYSEQNIIQLCEEAAGKSLASFFDDYVYGTKNYEPILIECFEYLGIEMKRLPNSNMSEQIYGFKTIDYGSFKKVSMVAQNSPAWKAGLSINDEIIAVNSFSVKTDLNDWLNYWKDDQIQLTVNSSGKIKQISLEKSDEKTTFFDLIKLTKKSNLTNLNLQSIACWFMNSLD